MAHLKHVTTKFGFVFILHCFNLIYLVAVLTFISSRTVMHMTFFIIQFANLKDYVPWLIRLEAYSVGTLYWGYLLLRNFASSGTLELIPQHMYRPEADSFSAKNIWARQTSSTCVIDIEPDSICIPFNAFMRNSVPAKLSKKSSKH